MNKAAVLEGSVVLRACAALAGCARASRLAGLLRREPDAPDVLAGSRLLRLARPLLEKELLPLSPTRALVGACLIAAASAIALTLAGARAALWTGGVGSLLLGLWAVPDAGVMLLIPAAVLSPKLFPFPTEYFSCRGEDIVLAAMLIGLLLRGRLGDLFRRSLPMTMQASLLVAACALSTALGLYRGTVTRPLTAFLYTLKIAELFVILHVFAVRWRFDSPRRRALVFACSVFVAGVFAIADHVLPPIYVDPPLIYRSMSMPPYLGEPNHFAGLFALACCAGAGVALLERRAPIRVAGALLALFVLAPLALTYSRQAMIALPLGLLAVCAVGRPKLLPLALLLVLAAALAAPADVRERLASLLSEATRGD